MSGGNDVAALDAPVPAACFGPCQPSAGETAVGFAIILASAVFLPMAIGRLFAKRIGDSILLSRYGVVLGLAAALPAWISTLVALHAGRDLGRSAWVISVALTIASLGFVTGVRTGLAEAPAPIRYFPVAIAILGIFLVSVQASITPAVVSRAMFIASAIEADAPFEGRLPAWWHDANAPFSLSCAGAMWVLAGAGNPEAWPG